MSQINLHEVAIGYLFAHQGEHLASDRHQLVKRCTAHIIESATDGITTAAAQLIALKALGEIESRGNNAHVDIGNSTSFAVFLTDPVSRIRYAFTAHDLVRLARGNAAQRVH